ncbi:MAG: UbiA family prenyltransferase [Bradymonadaceae bacterium]
MSGATDATNDDLPKSVITCDLEGRIETFNDGAEELFGYDAEEVVGRERVSLFSPGLVVLEHVERWLETAREEGEFETETVFERKDGSRFAAHIRITTTHRGGEQIGYCGVTEPLPSTDPEEVMPAISPWTHVLKWLVVTRAPFLSATLVPVLVGAAWVAHTGTGAFPWLDFCLALVGAAALHVAANCFNDYFDWESGADPANNNYFQSLTGGSRAVELGLVTQTEMFATASVAAALATICGLVLTARVGPGILGFGLFGLFSAYFYTAPPLRLVARRGLGELLIGLNFGPMMTAGTAYTLTGRFDSGAVLVGVPIGLLVTAILWINEFPDAPSDAEVGKNHLVVVLGRRTARWGYAGLLGLAFALVGIGAAAGVYPTGTLLSLVALPIAIYASAVAVEHYDDRQLVRANRATIALHAAAGALMSAGLLWNDLIAGLL